MRLPPAFVPDRPLRRVAAGGPGSQLVLEVRARTQAMSTAGIIRRKFAIGAITVREIRGLRLVIQLAWFVPETGKFPLSKSTSRLPRLDVAARRRTLRVR